MTRQRLSSSLFSRVSSRAEAIFICRGSMRFIIRLASLHEHSRIFFFPLAAFSCRFPPLGKDRRLFFVSPSATTDRWKWTIKRPTIPPGIVCFTLAGEKGGKKTRGLSPSDDKFVGYRYVSVYFFARNFFASGGRFLSNGESGFRGLWSRRT